MFKYLKYFNDEFVKYAQGLEENLEAPPRRHPDENLEAPPSRHVDEKISPAPSRHSVSAPANSGGLASNKSIQIMQQQLIGLAQDVTSQINWQQMESPGIEAGEASGRNAFADFITEHYLKDSDVPGVEFNPDPKRQQMSEKQPIDPTRMNLVMDTMRRIGNPKSGEFKDDGRWGPRTNAAIHNAYAFAYSMLNLANDFHVQPTYTKANLDDFKTKIPENDTDINILEKIKLSSEITTHIKDIRRMYREIKQSILEKPANRSYIEGDQAFKTYKREAPSFTQEDITNMSNQFDQTLRVSFNDENSNINQPITVKDLLTSQSLEAWQKVHAPGVPAENILNALRSALNMMHGSVSAKVDPLGQRT